MARFDRLMLIALAAVVACVAMLLPLRAFAGTVHYEVCFRANGGPIAAALLPCAASQEAAVGELTNKMNAQHTGWIDGHCPTVAGVSKAFSVGNACQGQTCYYHVRTTANSCTGAPTISELEEGVAVVDFGPIDVQGPPDLSGCNTLAQGWNLLGTGGVELKGSGGPNGLTFCQAGCAFQATGAAQPVGSTDKYFFGPYKFTGKSCDDAGLTGSDATPEPRQCPTGQCPGTFNGQSKCLPCGSQSADGPSTTASGPTGAPPNPYWPPGTTQETTSTTCTGGSCTTTTTYKDPNGNTTGTKTEEKPQDSFCKQNPESPMCKSSSFGGSCEATNCEGDAVQCAIAREQYKRNCEFFAPTGAAVDAGVAAATAGLRPSDHPGNSQETIGISGSFDQTDVVGSSCIGDFSVALLGSTLTVPMSRLCEPLSIAGNLAVSLALFVAAFIVFKE